MRMILLDNTILSHSTEGQTSDIKLDNAINALYVHCLGYNCKQQDIHDTNSDISI